MNVYDFDRTIYRGDSTWDFYFFILCRHPSVLLDLPSQLSPYTKNKAKRTDKTILKEMFFRFLHRIPDIDRDVRRFWDRNEKKIHKWYHNIKQPDDVIISASPEFLLEEIRRRLGAGFLIASKVDKTTGKFIGKNCRGAEKVVRFTEVFGTDVVDRFYSDSDSDEPMAKLAQNAYFVKRKQIKSWKL